MSIVVAVIAGLALTAAFPPLAQGWLAFPAIAAFQWSVLRARRPGVAALAGVAFGLTFVGLLVPWLRNVAGAAYIGFVAAHLPYFAAYGWVVNRTRHWPLPTRALVMAAGWVAVFFVLRWQPVLAIEWADPGYTVAPLALARNAAALWGATGWGVIIAVVATGVTLAATERSRTAALVAAAALVVAFGAGFVVDHWPAGEPVEVAVVQGHPPCPGFPCASTREQITVNHLRLTSTVAPGPDLVVWAESSVGFTTDPAQNPAVQDAIVEQARRLDAHMLIGADRPAGDANFVNANLMFDQEGRIVGEYRKQHGVPFGEYVPWRPVFGRLALLSRVPRDMIPGSGPVVLSLDGNAIGSVISFEAAFGRYAREHAALGAGLLVVNTNQSSYGRGSASDQIIAMTTMRASELGLDLVHAAITGRSTLIAGGVPGPRTPLYEDAVLAGTLTLRDAPPTPYARFGDWLVTVLLVVAAAATMQHLVVSLTANRPPPSAEVDAVEA